jgi:hypothetical protein
MSRLGSRLAEEVLKPEISDANVLALPTANLDRLQHNLRAVGLWKQHELPRGQYPPLTLI